MFTTKLADAELARLELEERPGQLVDAETVRREAFSTGRLVRDKLLALPGRISSQLSAMEDPAEVERLLGIEICAVLNELSGTGLR